MNGYLPSKGKQHGKNTVVEAICGSFHDYVQLIWNDRISEHLLAPDSRRHAWYSWISGLNDQNLNPDIIDFLSNSKSKEIVSDRFGSCPPGYISILRRLGTKARDRCLYQGLFALLDKGGPVCKILQHSLAIEDDVVFSLVAIPDDEFSSAIAIRLLQGSVDLEKLPGALWVASQLRSVFHEARIIDTVTNRSNPMRALQRLLLEVEFPFTPLRVEAPLFSVRSIHEIKKLGCRFRNCLRDRDCLSATTFAIQSGQEHLYRWEGEEPALILLKKFSAIGWVLEQASGVENRRLSEDTYNQIAQSFSERARVCFAWPAKAIAPSAGWFFSN